MRRFGPTLLLVVLAVGGALAAPYLMAAPARPDVVAVPHSHTAPAPTVERTSAAGGIPELGEPSAEPPPPPARKLPQCPPHDHPPGGVRRAHVHEDGGCYCPS